MRVARFKHWDVFLHENQYYLGRAYIWARRGDAVHPTQMTDEEWSELRVVMEVVEQVATHFWRPDLFNWAMLGNEAAHLHMHAVPRYRHPRTFFGTECVDRNWGGNWTGPHYDRTFRLPERDLLFMRDGYRTKFAEIAPAAAVAE